MKRSERAFCLDTGHLNVFSSAELNVWIQRLGPFIRQIHIHDNDGFLDQHLPPGQGNIDFNPLFRFLEGRVDDPPLITLEPHREEDLDPFLEFLDRHWPW